MLWIGFLRQLPTEIRYPGLVLAAFITGGVYMRAAFPMSMADFFIVATFLAARRGRWAAAGVLGAIGGAAYPDACLLLVPLTLLALYDGRALKWTVRLRQAATFAGLFVTGPALILVWQYCDLSRWNGFFLNQSYYDHGTHDPISIWWTLVSQLVHGTTGFAAADGAEGVVATLLVLTLTLAVGVAAWRRTISAWELSILLYIVLIYLYPLTLAGESWWRGDTLLLPGVLLFRHVNKTLAAVVTSAAVAVFPLLAVGYFQGQMR